MKNRPKRQAKPTVSPKQRTEKVPRGVRQAGPDGSFSDESVATDRGEDGDDEIVAAGTVICALTGQTRPDSPKEQTLQSVIEQFHHEYAIPLEDMERDFKLQCVASDPETGRER